MSERIAEDGEIIAFIVEYRDEHEYPPTITEIAERFKMARSNVHWHLARMHRDGMIVRLTEGPSSSKSRAIRITEEGMKLIPHPMEQF